MKTLYLVMLLLQSIIVFGFLGCLGSEPETKIYYDLEQPSVDFSQADFRSDENVTLDIIPAQDLEVQIDWLVNGRAIEQISSTLSNQHYQRGDVVEAFVYSVNGNRRSNNVHLSTVIQNTPPTGTLTFATPIVNTTEDIIPVVETQDYDRDQLLVDIIWTELNNGYMFEGDRLVASQTHKDQMWQPTLFLDDGYQRVELVGEVVSVLDSPSTILSVSILPTIPRVTDVLSPSIETIDLDNDAVPIFYRWHNGSEVAESPTLDGTFFEKGDVIELEASLTSDFTVSVLSDPVEVRNTPPEIEGVLFSAEEVYAEGLIECVVDGGYDVDGDFLQYELNWLLNGVYQQSGSALDLGSVGAVYGDTLTCEIRAFDGEDYSEWKNESIIVSNTPPVVTDALLSESVAYITSSIACLPQQTLDVDNQGFFTYQYGWYKNGESIDEPTGNYTNRMPEINIAGNYEVGDEIQCIVYASDGVDVGLSVSSNTLIVENRPPVATQVSVTPSQVYIDSELSCSLLDYYDADLNEDVSEIKWYLNGALVHEEADWTIYDETTGESLISIGDEILCEVTPSDGIVSLAPISISTVVNNKPPEVLVAYINPSTPASNHNASIESIYEDVDGDLVTLSYDWFQNGALISNEQILEHAMFERGDQLQARITPSSNGMNGAPYLTDLVEVGNGYPDPATPVIEPLGPREGIDDLHCRSLTPPSDPDGDETVHTYSWQVNGNWTMYTVDTIPATEIQAGDVWVCLITAVDAEGAERGAAAHTIIRRSDPLWTELFEFDPVVPVFVDSISATVPQEFVIRDGEECWAQQDTWSSLRYNSFRSVTELEAIEANLTVYSPDTEIELVFQGETFNTTGFEDYWSVRLFSNDSGTESKIEWGGWSLPNTTSGDQQSVTFAQGFTLGQTHNIRVETDALLGLVTVYLDESMVLQSDQVPFLDVLSSEFFLRSYRDSSPADVCWRDVFLYEGNP